MTETLDLDPCLVAGTLVAGSFGARGIVVRQGFRDHPKVARWLVKHRTVERDVTVLPQHAFEDLAHEAIRA